MERRAPSARLEAQLAEVLGAGIVAQEQLAEVGRLGASTWSSPAATASA